MKHEMKKPLILLMLLVLTLTLNAEWKAFKRFERYSGEEFNLKNNVAYMEIRLYKSKKSARAYKIFPLYRKPLSSYPKNVIYQFKNLETRYSDKESYLRIRNNGNAFFIDTHGKMFWTDENKDIIELLGTIDTPAELALALWLQWGGGRTGWTVCKKTSNGFKVHCSTYISECSTESVVGFVDKKGNYDSGKYIRHIIRKNCKRAKSIRFINHKKINYESYIEIALDRYENIYTLGRVNKNKTYHSDSYYVLDKYNSNGKLIWSRKSKNYISDLIVKNNFIYLIENKKIVIKYDLNGKQSPFKRGEIAINLIKKKSKKNYTPAINKKEKGYVDIYMSDYAISKKGNIYSVGHEEFYPNKGIDADYGSVDGAFVARFNPNGKLIWAKILDRDN